MRTSHFLENNIYLIISNIKNGRNCPVKSFMRRKIRLIESNVKCLYLKQLTCKRTLWQVFICLSPLPLLVFCLGCCSNLIGSESGQKQSVKTPSEYGLQHNSTPSQPHTVCTVYNVLLTLERGGGTGEGGEPV